jgi:DNA mismatch repair protein MutL
MHTLDTLTATQLAAGATIDRPAAVVRELLDNAIDAGARHIWVAVGEGAIQVRDDGCGMSPDELVLAFQRHTTSKLQHANDTVGIATLGFRGEALAALAAVAAVSAVSRRGNDMHATEVRFAAGELQDLRACAGRPGTTVTVERLFYTSPHRRTFWRQPHVELQRIADMTSRYALCYPHIAFTSDIAQTEPMCTQGSGDVVRTISELWGDVDPFAIHATLPGTTAQLSGFVASPHTARPLRRRQIIAVNQRPIAPRGTIAHLLDEVLPPQRTLYPACVLQFTLPSESIEVNSREGKEDVMLRAPSVVARLVYAGFTAPSHTPDIGTALLPFPPLQVLGFHHDWIVASAAEGVFMLSPANIMRHCGIDALERGALIVPPLRLSRVQCTRIQPHQHTFTALGVDVRFDDNDGYLHALPARARAIGPATALTHLVKELRNGGTPAAAVGWLLEPTWVLQQLTRHRDPWGGHTSLVIGHHRVQHALRRSFSSATPDG